MAAFWEELLAFFTSFADPYFRRATLIDFGRDLLHYLRQLLPYVVAGCFLGELLKFTSWTKLVYRFTRRFRFLVILAADVLGILSPLCTYGTVPVLISLYGGGVSLGPLIAFLAASSMMNPQLFVMTVGGLGWEMALLRLLCVFVFAKENDLEEMTAREVDRAVKAALEVDPEAEEAIVNRTRKPFSLKLYLKLVGKNLLFVGRMMCIGILIAAVVDFLPLSRLFGGVDTTTPLGILTAAIAGIPLYACGGGTIPMIASLMSQGLSRGSALAFLTAGPATRVTSLSAIAAIFRKRFLLCYVLVLLAFSVLAGMLFV